MKGVGEHPGGRSLSGDVADKRLTFRGEKKSSDRGRSREKGGGGSSEFIKYINWGGRGLGEFEESC